MSSQAKTRNAVTLERTMRNTLDSMHDFTSQFTFDDLPDDFQILSVEPVETELSSTRALSVSRSKGR